MIITIFKFITEGQITVRVLLFGYIRYTSNTCLKISCKQLMFFFSFKFVRSFEELELFKAKTSLDSFAESCFKSNIVMKYEINSLSCCTSNRFCRLGPGAYRRRMLYHRAIKDIFCSCYANKPPIFRNGKLLVYTENSNRLFCINYITA